MDPAHLLGALVRGALAGKTHKRSSKALRYLTGNSDGLLNATTMMTAAGVAWGLFETWQNSQSDAVSQPVPQTPPTPRMPLPSPAVATLPADLSPAVLRLVRLTVSAARADGALGSDEREAILAQARSVGAEAFVLGELDRTTPLSEIVAGVSEARENDALYALAFSIVRADESLTGAERIYLAQLAALLGLDAASTSRLEHDIAGRIDAQADVR